MIHLAALISSGSTTATTLAGAAHKSSGSILDPIAKPIAWVLAEIYAVIPNYGIAIMILSVIWMIIIAPLTLKSTRSMLAMQKLQPKLKKLQDQHKNDRQAFAQAQMDLFREHNVSPFGSCLPMLLPMPVFFALFRVIQGLSHHPFPKYLSPSTEMYKDIVAAHGQLNAFGMNLANNAFSPHGSFLAALPYWILLVVMGATSYIQSSQMMSRNPAAQNNPQMKMMKYLPLLFVLFCVRFPAGVVLYYAMSNICRIVQQDAMYRYDPKVRALVAQEVVEVEELTEEIDRQKGKAGNSGSAPSGRAGSAPKKPPTPPSGGNGSRSRFRDLLAAAAEQQQQKGQQAKASGSSKTNGSTNGSLDKSPTTNGKQSAGDKQGGSGQGGTGQGGTGQGGTGQGGTGQGATGASKSRTNPGAKNKKRRGR